MHSSERKREKEKIQTLSIFLSYHGLGRALNIFVWWVLPVQHLFTATENNHGQLRDNIFSPEMCSQKADQLLCCPVNFWKEINEHGHFTLQYTFHHSDIHFCKTSWICSTVFYFFWGSSIPGWVIFRFLWFLRRWSWGSFDFMYNYNWLNIEEHLW